VFQTENRATEAFEHTSEVLDVSWAPDGRQICSCTLDGNVWFWNPESGSVVRLLLFSEAKDRIIKMTNHMIFFICSFFFICFISNVLRSVIASIDGKRDVMGGRKKHEVTRNAIPRNFNS
jgi:WD40 repeat protein